MKYRHILHCSLTALGLLAFAASMFCPVYGIETGTESRIYTCGDVLVEGVLAFPKDVARLVVTGETHYRSGQEFLDDFMENTPDIRTYASSAKEYEHYDFKNRGIDTTLNNRDADIYRHRGMNLTIAGVQYIASARDVGNFAAGYVAGKNHISWWAARIAFDALESFQKSDLKHMKIKLSVEGQPTQQAQRLGYKIGTQKEKYPKEDIILFRRYW